MKRAGIRKAVLVAAVLALTLTTGCGREDEGPVLLETVDILPESQSGEGQPAQGATGEKQEGNEQGDGGQPFGQAEGQQTGNGNPESGQQAAEFSFGDLAGWTFDFSSGAGAWFTELTIDSGGRVKGHYQDADMGDNGDAYPNGTLYLCDFTGRFGDLEKVDAYTWQMKLQSLTFEQEPEKEEIVDGVRQIYSSAYGLDGGETFLLYLPGIKMKDLPEEYLSWARSGIVSDTLEELPCYGLYNVNTGGGFSSHQYEERSLAERIALEISFAEEQEQELEAKLQEATTQTDMTTISTELFQTWDDTLNIVWKLLESELDSGTMDALRVEEREWITWKDKEVEAAGLASEGGSIQSMDEAVKAAELTKERVYKLAEYAK